MRDRLIELLKKADKYASGICTDYDEAQAVCAEYLISEGVIVPNVATAVDFVEPVRCKDCKYWKDTSFDTITGWHWGECRKPLGDYRYCETADIDFCSYGERRNNL